jgi:DNA-binding NtrC family response regulator
MCEKIVIVDQDIDSAHILQEHIKRLDYQKILISTSTHVLEDLLENQTYRYLFLDFETIAEIPLEKLKHITKLRTHVSVILLHCEFQQAVANVQHTLQTNAFLKKPVVQSDLQDLFIALKAQ